MYIYISIEIPFIIVYPSVNMVYLNIHGYHCWFMSDVMHTWGILHKTVTTETLRLMSMITNHTNLNFQTLPGLFSGKKMYAMDP